MRTQSVSSTAVDELPRDAPDHQQPPKTFRLLLIPYSCTQEKLYELTPFPPSPDVGIAALNSLDGRFGLGDSPAKLKLPELEFPAEVRGRGMGSRLDTLPMIHLHLFLWLPPFPAGLMLPVHDHCSSMRRPRLRDGQTWT